MADKNYEAYLNKFDEISRSITKLKPELAAITTDLLPGIARASDEDESAMAPRDTGNISDVEYALLIQGLKSSKNKLEEFKINITALEILYAELEKALEDLKSY